MGGWGGGGDGGGNFWSRIGAALADAKKEDESEAFDSHGLPAGFAVQPNRLSASKRYKVSGVDLYDIRNSKTILPSDPFYELLSLKPGAIYTKAHLQAELDNLTSSGMFEKVDLEAIAQPDGTIKLKFAFLESQWQSSESFRCINVGLLAQPKPKEVDFNSMSDSQKERFIRDQELEYRRRIRDSRSCILPKSVEREIQKWLLNEGRVTARQLQRIRDRVQRWYHEQGYACAQVVNFGNLNSKEIVCEVVEGDITKVDVQFQDKMGNTCEGNTREIIIRRELPKQVLLGLFFFFL